MQMEHRSVGCCAAKTGFDAAQAMIRAHAAPLAAEEIALADAGLRVLAAPLRALVDSPRRDCAAMDGFAVRSADMDGSALPVVGTSAAGGPMPPALTAGVAVAVATGAPMPPGADRVVVAEQVRVEGGRIVCPAPTASRHVRPLGSDFTAGSVVLDAGTLLDPRALVAAAAADVDRIAVWRRPRLHLICNGDELAAPGTARRNADHIPDSLTAGLLLLARQWGAETAASRIGDDRAAITAAVDRARCGCDILVVAGGASIGARDLARSALAAAGLDLRISGVAIRPGKPLWYGTMGPIHVLGLPGNPAAAMTTARLFMAPLVAAVSGRTFDSALQWQHRPSATAIPAAGPRDTFLFAAREGSAARVLERQESSSQLLLATADVLVHQRAAAAVVAPGQPVRCLDF
jgi:molybdopterin molybdotransferase